MCGVRLCSVECEHLRSFRDGFDGKRIFAPYDKRDRFAVCLLRPEAVLSMRVCPVCWRTEDF